MKPKIDYRATKAEAFEPKTLKDAKEEIGRLRYLVRSLTKRKSRRAISAEVHIEQQKQGLPKFNFIITDPVGNEKAMADKVAEALISVMTVATYRGVYRKVTEEIKREIGEKIDKAFHESNP